MKGLARIVAILSIPVAILLWYAYPKYIREKAMTAETIKSPSVQNVPLCAGDYDFSRIELPASGEEMRKITVNFQPNCRTEVSLPPCANYRTRPSTDYEIRFIDGTKFIGGPGKQTWFGVHRGLFAVQGLTQAGTLEIFLEKK